MSNPRGSFFNQALVVFFVCLFLLLIAYVNAGRPTENERVRLWHEAGNTWPPKWQEESPKRRQFMVRDIEQEKDSVYSLRLFYL